ncbi:hypothetical protein MKZ87_27700, partial [Pseudomonas sp. MCal1]|uniref:hypothetical protein n=1 Tax=Pseudomonas sp. MCal1 TaxID=2919887 RepID=UPI002250E0EB
VCSHEHHQSNRRSCLCVSRDSVKNQMKGAYTGGPMVAGKSPVIDLPQRHAGASPIVQAPEKT